MKKIYSISIIAVMIFMSAITASADLTDGLVAYYQFNGNANDESGNGNDGTVYGATLAQDRFGNFDSAFSFNGISDYINIGKNVKPPFPVSVSLWVNTNDLDANGCGVAGVVRNDQYDDDSYRYGLTVRIDDGYLISHYFEGSSAPWNRIGYISNDAIISIDNWYHLVVIFNAHKNIRLFVNGVEQPGHYDDGTGSGMLYSDSGNGAIGMFRCNRPVRTCYFNGIVDDIRFYNRALSEQEIRMLYNEIDGDGYLVTSDLWIKAVINTVEKGPVEAVWQEDGEDTTNRGDKVIWGHFYASPSDVTWGSESNPDLFVKIWLDVSGRIDVNYLHVSVPDIEVYSDYPYDETPDKHSTVTMSTRHIRHEYWR
jgi:hypothetical protein